MYELLIKNGSIPNFGSRQMEIADVAISGGKIVEVGKIDKEAETTIDATGKIVSPGFIDLHMHEEDFCNEGKKPIVSKLMLNMGVTTCVGGNCGVQYQGIEDFKSGIESLGGMPTNYLMLSGYNYFREKQGIGRYDLASQEVIDKIIEEINFELTNGAYGVSFGIEYDPGITFQEIVRVLENVEDKAFVSMHYREDSAGSMDAVSEMINIAETTKQRFQISHLSSCSAMGQMDEALNMISEAINKNERLGFDTYPYNAFSTEIGSAVFDDGCFERWGKSYDAILITDGKYKGQYCTKEIFEEVRQESPNMLVVAFVMNEEEIQGAIVDKNSIIASDGIMKNGSGHPRVAGTFPRLLGKYVREEKCISMIDAIEKITKIPAKRLELIGKGEIKLNYDGDITIFDPNEIIDLATFEDGTKAPKGIDMVIVNGKIAKDKENIINSTLGKFIASEFTKDNN